MVGWDAKEKFPKGFVPQAKQTLENIVAVLTEGGAQPEHIVRLTWYVLDMDEYLACRRELGAAYRAVLGDHFPAMALVQVGRLFEPEARLEIEATAVVPVNRGAPTLATLLRRLRQRADIPDRDVERRARCRRRARPCAAPRAPPPGRASP